MKDIHQLSENYFEDAISSLKGWIRIDSVYDADTVSETKPFGAGVASALEYIASIAENDGFTVDRCEGYCTEIGCGEGPLIAIYAHADVVPVSGEWKFPPFSATIENDIMYGRGTSDDKGPAMAAYYALKLLRDHHLIDGFRATLVIGGNEESGSRCLEHYFGKLKKPYPSYGFTPDGDFPLIYGEKAIATYSVLLERPVENLISLSGGVVINSVIDEACCVLKKMPEREKIAAYCEENGLRFDTDGNRLTMFGKAAHGSIPEEGINAGLHLLKFIGLNENVPEFVKTADGYLDGSGKNLGIYSETELLHGTTYNVGLISYRDGKLEYRVNFRYPENVDAEKVCAYLDTLGLGRVTFEGTSSYLLMDPSSEMIQTLLACYREETGDIVSSPMAIGGGTYAKESRNTVAFGSHFPGREDHIHEANEKIHLDDLRRSIAIYAKAIRRLGALAGEKK